MMQAKDLNKIQIVMSKFSYCVLYMKDRNITASAVRSRIKKWWTEYQIINTPYKQRKVKDNPEYKKDYLEFKPLKYLWRKIIVKNIVQKSPPL